MLLGLIIKRLVKTLFPAPNVTYFIIVYNCCSFFIVSNANEDSQSPTKQTFPPVQDPYDKDSNINNNLELYQHQMRMPERNSVKIFQHPGDSSRNTIGNFKSEVNNTPMELYHHPLQIPNAKVSRNTISRENYSPEEVDELQALKKQNLELKNQVAGLRTTVSFLFLEILYSYPGIG